MPKGAAAALALLLAAAAMASSQDFVGADAALLSRRVFRGYDRADSWSSEARIGLGLLGYATTSLGKNALFLDLDGGLLVDAEPGRERERDLALTLAYERKLGEAGDDRLRLQYRHSFFGDGTPSQTGEMLARYQPLVSFEGPGLALHPFVEVVYDFKRYDGVYTAVGLEHAFSLEKRFHVRGSLDVEGRVGWSNQKGRLGAERAFGFHHGRLFFELPFERELGDTGTLAIGPVAGWDWAPQAIRLSRAFAWGVRAKLVH
jgi:hypothetical protein